MIIDERFHKYCFFSRGIGYPSELVKNKVISQLDKHCRHFISQSPLLFMSTSDQAGNCDVSPRGDEPGFVMVLDERRLCIPERPGNRRVDSMQNIISNPKIGLIFIIPGLNETLRINGVACVIRDEKLLKKMEFNGHIPILGVGVEIEDCYIHCGKPFIRSKLWNPESWQSKGQLPNMAQMLSIHANLPGMDDKEVAELLNESYTKRLY